MDDTRIDHDINNRAGRAKKGCPFLTNKRSGVLSRFEAADSHQNADGTAQKRYGAAGICIASAIAVRLKASEWG